MKNQVLTGSIIISFLLIGTVTAGIVGDINNDAHIDLTEAIYALQVSAGAYPDIASSCQLEGKFHLSLASPHRYNDITLIASVSGSTRILR